MNETLKITLLGLAIIGLGIIVLSALSYSTEQVMKSLRESNSPTKYEYKVVSANIKEPFIGENYYEITYLDLENVIITKGFDTNSKLRFVLSDEKRL